MSFFYCSICMYRYYVLQKHFLDENLLSKLPSSVVSGTKQSVRQLSEVSNAADDDFPFTTR